MSDLDVEEIDQTGDDEVTSLEEGKILDYITGEPVKDTPKEQVRQRIARAPARKPGSAAARCPDHRSAPRSVAHQLSGSPGRPDHHQHRQSSQNTTHDCITL